MGRLPIILGFCFVAVMLSACSKINICAKEEKLLGAWEYTSLSIGDSTILPEFDLTAFGIDSSDLDSLDLFFGVVFAGEGLYYNWDFIAPGYTGVYRMDRYETDCLIYLDGEEFRWEINSLSDDVLDVSTYAKIGDDSLVRVTAELQKYSPIYFEL